MTDPKRAEAPDFGTPWRVEGRVSLNGPYFTIVTRDGRRALDETYYGKETADRIVACVNACAGMADPAKEIEAMRMRHPAKRVDVEDLSHETDRILDAWDRGFLPTDNDMERLQRASKRIKAAER